MLVVAKMVRVARGPLACLLKPRGVPRCAVVAAVREGRGNPSAGR